MQVDKDQYRTLKAQRGVNTTRQTNASYSNQSLFLGRRAHVPAAQSYCESPMQPGMLACAIMALYPRSLPTRNARNIYSLSSLTFVPKSCIACSSSPSVLSALISTSNHWPQFATSREKTTVLWCLRRFPFGMKRVQRSAAVLCHVGGGFSTDTLVTGLR